MWLVLCGWNIDFHRQYNVVEDGLLNSFVTEMLPESFVFPWTALWTETNHPWKSANHSAGTLFLWKHFHLIAVTGFALSRQPLLHLHFPFYKHIHKWELTSHDVCLIFISIEAPAGPAWSRNCSCRAAEPRCWRAGAANWPEWLQSEPITDKRWIALQNGADSIVLCDRATIALLTKQRTGVQALSCSGGLPSNSEWAPPRQASHTLSKHTECLDCSALCAFMLWGKNPSQYENEACSHVIAG